MLKPEFLEETPNAMLELYARTEEIILADMARRIKKYDFYIPAAQWQKHKLKDMGLFETEILKELNSLTKLTEEELKRLMLEAGMAAIEEDDRVHTEAGKKCPPIEASPNLINALNSGYRRTAKLFRNLTKTTAANASRQFSEVLDLAHMQVISGAFDTDTAVRNAIKSAAKHGLDAVRYPSGRVDSIETAVRRAVVTGVNQTAADMQLARIKDVGCDYVETTAHAGARPDHQVWQGKVFKLEGEDDKYKNFYKETGYGTGPGLCGWNCRHNFHPFYPGITEHTYTKEMLDSYSERCISYNGREYTEYEATRIQRYYESKRRKWKKEFVMLEAAELDTTEASVKLRSYMEKEKDFEKQTGLPSNSTRMTVAGYGNREAGKSQWEARRYYQWFKRAYSLEGEGMKETLASYYDMKYNNLPEYKTFKQYVLSVERGEISPLLGLSVYREAVNQIDKDLIGLKTPQGIEIKDYSAHFVGRMIGRSAPNKKYNRAGVKIEDLKRCITKGQEMKSIHEDTITLVGSRCQIVYNPRTGVLVQTNRKEKKL